MSAPPIVLLPGHMCDGRMWRATVPALVASGYSAEVVPLLSGSSIDEMADEILAETPTRFIAVGFSMGGIVAMALARRSPDRLAGLVLLDTNATADLPDRAAARLVQQESVRNGGLARVVAEELKPNYLSPTTRHRSDLLELFMEMAIELGPEAFMVQSEALRLRPDARAELANTRCPALVACGADDPLCPPAWHEAIASSLPAAELAVVPDAGHMLPLERPDAFNAVLLAWLNRNYG